MATSQLTLLCFLCFLPSIKGFQQVEKYDTNSKNYNYLLFKMYYFMSQEIHFTIVLNKTNALTTN